MRHTLLATLFFASILQAQTLPAAAPATAPATSAASRPVDGASKVALDWLAKSLKGEQSSLQTMMVLRSTGDKELLPLFVELSRSGDKQQRLATTDALGDLGGQAAIDALGRQLASDPAMAICCEALVQLKRLKALAPEQLQTAIKTDDQSIQCIAARCLAASGKVQLAMPVLDRLAGSSDLATSAMARMSLLGLGDAKQLAPLKTLMLDPKTPGEVIALLLEQVHEEKIKAAAELVEALAAKAGDPILKARCCKALSAVKDQPEPMLAQALVDNEETVFRVPVMRLLAEQPKAGAELERLAARKDVLGTLARLELVRGKDLSQASPAIKEALALGHPIVIQYVLSDARSDAQSRPHAAGAYVGGLLDLIGHVAADADEPGTEHMLAAQAATLLCDLGTPAAADGLKKLLAERYSARLAACTTGVAQSRNTKLSAELLAPLVESPYEDVATDSALALAKAGDPHCQGPLVRIIQQPSRQGAAMATLAAWRLLKSQGNAQQAVEALCEAVRTGR